MKLRHRFVGWDETDALLFDTAQGRIRIHAAAAILALGGASWPKLGSDGGWVDAFAGANIAVTPLRPANCGFVADWSEPFRERFQGQPLKRIGLSFGGRELLGEALITWRGLEGSGIYALSAPLREAIAAAGEAVMTISLRPGVPAAELQRNLETPRRKQSLSTFLRKVAKLPPAAIGLLREAAGEQLSGLNAGDLAALIQAVPVRLVATAPLEREISTAGGISFDELDERFMVRRRPGVFAAGEMLDWEAPTGGYLLQASFATGAAAARGTLAWLEGRGK
jgi:uncharacterized flavoprotein (TIGR03862 family)